MFATEVYIQFLVDNRNYDLWWLISIEWIVHEIDEHL
jgi:hypothetical protein